MNRKRHAGFVESDLPISQIGCGIICLLLAFPAWWFKGVFPWFLIWFGLGFIALGLVGLYWWGYIGRK